MYIQQIYSSIKVILECTVSNAKHFCNNCKLLAIIKIIFPRFQNAQITPLNKLYLKYSLK